MSNIAIIPARAGSKRILGKNIKSFYGKPIISWVLELALNSKFFDKIVVSTDSEEISKISLSQGVEVPFLRPHSLSDDNISVIEVVRHAINFFKENNEDFDLATLIYPTAPLLDQHYLNEGIKAISEYDFSISVTDYSYPIQRALAINERSNVVQILENGNFYKRSQDFPKRYHDAGQFIVGKVSSWLSKTPLVDGRAFPVRIPRYRVQDIDEETDWKEAELKFSIIKTLEKREKEK